MRFVSQKGRLLVFAGLMIALPVLAGCNTLKGAGKDIQKIGEGVQKGAETVEQEVTN